MAVSWRLQRCISNTFLPPHDTMSSQRPAYLLALLLLLLLTGACGDGGMRSVASLPSIFVQVGTPRSASTYQWTALKLIGAMAAASSGRRCVFDYVRADLVAGLDELCADCSTAFCVVKVWT